MKFVSHQKVNRDQLFNVIEESLKFVNPIKCQKDQHLVIVQGFSGVGKSSMVLTLSGESMVGYHHPESKVPILMSKNKEGRNGIKIEKEILAGTIRPACASMDRSKFKEEVTLWDMPGIGENRGLTQSLINSYYCMKIFQAQPQVKIALTITHGDINLGNKGIHLSNVLGDFIKMFGNVELYEKSLFVVITKAPLIFKKEDAINSFAKINDLPAIRNNFEVSKLVQKLSDNMIPILVFNQPNLGLLQLSQEAQRNVSKDYTTFIDDFNRTVVSLQKSEQLKLKSAELSSEDTDSCIEFADKIRDQLNGLISSFKKGLSQFVKASCPSIEHPFDIQTQNAVIYMETMRSFINKFQIITDVYRQQDKKSLKQRLSKLTDLLAEFDITIQILQYQKKIELKIRPLMDRLDRYFMLINFLNHLNLNKKQRYEWIDQINLIRQFLMSLQGLRIDLMWREVEASFKQVIKRVIEDKFVQHVQGLEHSDIHNIWANSFRYFPSFSLRLSKFLPVDKLRGKNCFRNYFQYIHEVEQDVGINCQELQMINQIIRICERLEIQWQEELVFEKFDPMIRRQQKELIDEKIKYQIWSQELVTKSLKSCTRALSVHRMDKIEHLSDHRQDRIYDRQYSEPLNIVNSKRTKHLFDNLKKEDEVLNAIQTNDFLKNKILELQRSSKEKSDQLQVANRKIEDEKAKLQEANRKNEQDKQSIQRFQRDIKILQRTKLQRQAQIQEANRKIARGEQLIQRCQIDIRNLQRSKLKDVQTHTKEKRYLCMVLFVIIIAFAIIFHYGYNHLLLPNKTALSMCSTEKQQLLNKIQSMTATNRKQFMFQHFAVFPIFLIMIFIWM